MSHPFSPAAFSNLVNSYLPEPEATLLNGILFGLPVPKGSVLLDQLKTTGLLHLVVLSGMNITIIAQGTRIALARFGKRVSLAGAAGCVAGFTLFVGPEPPIVRASIMGTLSLLAVYLGRRYEAVMGLFVSALIIALVSPVWLSGLSFQLSFGATLGIMLFAGSPGLGANARIPPFITWILKELRMTLSASLFTVPLIFFAFRRVSLIAPVANLLVSWMIAPLMVFGMIACLLGTLNPAFGLPAAYLCYGLLHMMNRIVVLLDSVPFASVDF